MNRVLQFIGSICFGICGIPAAIGAIAGDPVSMSWIFLGLWLVGEICMIIWSIRTRMWLMLLNFIPNFLCLIILMWYNGGNL